ncbi:hypothetical protein PZA11_004922 [Diplocarpon coronariae]
MAMNAPRTDADGKVDYISPQVEVAVGLWTLFAGAFLFLGLRIYSKLSRRNGLWYDDHLLIFTCLLLFTNDVIITVQYATGYAKVEWDDRMQILINISSGNTIWGQALSKTALGLTLLRMSSRKQSAILWFCIFTMNAYTLVKYFFIWVKFCNRPDYQQYFRLDGPCVDYDVVQRFKLGGNVYNIIMDFVFAAFPWWITWNLEMRRIEKIALCATMSLGMAVAIMSLARTIWRDTPMMTVRDEGYVWRNGMSNIWFSAEVAGTIIVQCVPILRTFVRDLRTSNASKRLGDSEGTSLSRRSVQLNADDPRSSARPAQTPGHGPGDLEAGNNSARDGKHAPEPEVIALEVLSDDASRRSFVSDAPSDRAHDPPTRPAGPLSHTRWRPAASEPDDLLSPHSWLEPADAGMEHQSHGLSPAPPLRR